MADPVVFEVSSPRVLFGVGATAQVPDEVWRLGGRAVLLIAGGHETATADRIAAVLGDAVADRINKVAAHVPAEVADAATARARGHRADLVVCVGGGSATGLAKAVALETGLPILAVPTTYAGSEMTDVWGRTQDVDGVPRKVTGRDWRVRARTVVYDPELTVSLPPALSAASGLNAMAHLIGALYARSVAPIVPALAEEGIRTLAGALPKVVAHPSDLDARSDALYGAWLAGWVLGCAPMGLHHKLCHVLGGAYQLPHAGVHAALLPYTTAVAAATGEPARSARAARALGDADAAEALYDLARAVGAPATLAHLGFDEAHIDEVAGAVTAQPETVRALLHAAYRGHRPHAMTLR